MATLKLILIDANLAFARAAKSFLESLEDVAEVRSSRTLASALKILPTYEADIVIADSAALGWESGWEAGSAVARLKSAAGAGTPALHVVLLSLDDSREARAEGLAAGADAFLGKAEFGEKFPALMESLERRHAAA